jgi:hypothetical protein
MNIYKIKTTSYEEEDFYILTELNEQDVVLIIKPIVKAERDGGDCYDNESLVASLQSSFRHKKTEMYIDFETIIF